MEEWAKKYIEKPVINKESIVFELYDGRNTLERALLHFADFEKRAERLGGRHYRIKVVYMGKHPPFVFYIDSERAALL